MKFLATILAVLVIQIVDAVEEEGDVNIIIKQNVVLPDVDECLEKIDACAENELCINMPGTYRCACLDGFEKVKGICKDIDECIEYCGVYGECINSPGSFTCTCNDGCVEVEGICEDIDECTENCGIYGECINSPGSFTCTCNDGCVEVEGICEDIDECTENCGTYGICVNSPGSFTCTCNEGFEEVEGICEDIDECIENCGAYGVCLNSPGSFTCTCNKGFEEVEGICEDIDECKDTTSNPCGDNAICTNTIGSYTCTCINKYTKVFGNCTECSSDGLFDEELGCIEKMDGKKTWADANSYCQNQDRKLPEGIKLKHIIDLKAKFFVNVESLWIGMQNSRWYTSNEEVPKGDEVWRKNEPSLNNDMCGLVFFTNADPGLTDEPCSDIHYFLCQSLL